MLKMCANTDFHQSATLRFPFEAAIGQFSHLFARRKALHPSLLCCSLMLTVLLASLTGCTNLGSQPTPSDPTIISQLSDAGFNLSRDMGAHYTGQVTTLKHGTFQVDLQVTNTGSAWGTLTQGSETIHSLVIDGKTFIQASQAYWQKNGANAETATLYSEQWVKVSPNEFGIDVEQRLAPAELGHQLSQVSSTQSVNSGETTQINGVTARRISTPYGTAFVTTAEPYRMIRIDSPNAAPTQSRAITTHKGFDSRRVSADLSFAYSSQVGEESFQLFLQEMSITEVENLLSQLNTSVEKLQTSLDSLTDFKLDSTQELDPNPCAPTSCTVKVIVTNSVSSTSPYVKFNQPIDAYVYIVMKLDGIQVGTPCGRTVEMEPNGESSPVLCTAQYVEPQDGLSHEIAAEILIEAEAVSSVDRERLLEDLAKQTLSWRLRSVGPYGLPGWSRNDGPYTFVPPKSYNPKASNLQPVQGGFVDEDGAIWQLGNMHNLDYRRRGILKEWDVQLTKQQGESAKWEHVAKLSQNSLRPNEQGFYHANITPDGYLSH